MLEEPWLLACKRLPIGGTARFRCCGRTPAAVLYNKPESYEMWCHRCKGTAYKRKEFINLAAPVAEASVQPVPADVIRLTDASAEIQSLCYNFIVSKGLMPGMLAEGVSWSGTKKRLLFPVSSQTYLARSLTTYQNPKWLMLGQPLQYAPAAPADLSQVSQVALTEDYLSALKLSYVSTRWMSSAVLPIALLGTRLSPTLKASLVSMNLPVCIMLDGDSAGVAGTAAVRRTLKPFLPLREFSIEGLDPKDMTIQQIMEGFNWML